jgi:hypothetical protein
MNFVGVHANSFKTSISDVKHLRDVQTYYRIHISALQWALYIKFFVCPVTTLAGLIYVQFYR